MFRRSSVPPIIKRDTGRIREVAGGTIALMVSVALAAATVKQGWTPLGIAAGAGFVLLTAANPFLVAITAIFAVSLSPELPLGLPFRFEDFVLPWGVVLLGGQLALGRTSWPRVLNWQPCLALLAVELAATLIGAAQGTTQLHLTTYSGTIFLAKSVEMLLLYVTVIWLLDTPAKIRTYTWALLIGGALLGTYGMVTHISVGDPYAPVVDIEGGMTYSLIALALLVPLALGISLGLTGATRARGASMLLLIPVVYSLVFSLSRQTYIGLFAMLFLILWVGDRRWLTVAIPLLLLIPRLLPEAVMERVSNLIDPFTGDVIGSGVYTTRINAWQNRFPEMFYTNPVTGRGLASLPPGFLDSQYLVALYYTGFVGLGVFLWLLGSFGRQAWRLYRSAAQPWGQALGLAGLAAVVGFGVAGLGGSPFVAVRARGMFWLLMAGVAACLTLMDREDEETNEGAPD